MKAEHIDHRLIELALLPAKQIAARRGFQPVSQTYNRAVLRHEFNCTAIFSNKSIGAPDARREATVIGPAEPAPASAAMSAAAPTLAGILVTHRRCGTLEAFAAGGIATRFAAADAARAARAALLDSKDNKR